MGLFSRIRANWAAYDEFQKSVIAVTSLLMAVFIAAMAFLISIVPPATSAAAPRLLITHEAAFVTSTASRLASYSAKNQAPDYVQTAVTEYNQAQAALAGANGSPRVRATAVPGSAAAISFTLSNDYYAKKACATYSRTSATWSVVLGRCR